MFVVVVRCRVVLTWQVTGGAEGIALGAQLSAVGVVAVAASDAARVHLALEERAPVVNLAALLAINMIKRAGEQRWAIIVKERLPRFVALGDLAATGVTLRADLDLALGCARLRAHCVAARRVHSPSDVPPFIEARAQTLGAVFRRGLAYLLRLGPRQMARAGAVAGLATHTDLRPARLESISDRIVVFAHI